MMMFFRPIVISIALIVMLLVVPLIVNGLWTSVFVLESIVIVFWLSFVPVRVLYGGTLSTALGRHILNMLTFFNRFQVIRDGRSMIPATDGDVLGPRIVVINPGSAVVMEQGGRQTRVSGPDILQSGFFEYVRRAYNLRCQQEIIRPPEVLTSDLIPTTIMMCVSYRLNVRPEVSTGDEPLNAVEEQLIQHIDLNMPDWEQETRSVVQGIARQAASELRLGELMTAVNTAAIERRIERESNRRLNQRGILVEQIVIENIQPRADTVSAAADLWIAQNAQMPIELAKARTWQHWLSLLVDAYERAMDANIEPGVIQHEALYRALQELSQNVSLHITPENSETIREPFRLLTRDRSA